MTDLAFDRSYPFEYGILETLSPLVRRLVARNPSPFTFHGTAAFVIGRGEVAVIDPGPALPEHVETLVAALDGEQVTHLLVTHTHLDHSPACAGVKAATGAPTFGFGPHGASRLEAGVRVEEGADWDFVPDRALVDGDRIRGAGWTLECVHTPGHTSNHLCFGLHEERTLFTGDHVMAWNTSVISPPDGDMTAYLRSLHRLLDRDDLRYRPTHGPAVEHPRAWVRAYLGHRALREEQILACIARGEDTVPAMVAHIYRDLPAKVHGAAARMLLSTLVHLAYTGRVVADGEPSLASPYRLKR